MARNFATAGALIALLVASFAVAAPTRETAVRKATDAASSEDSSVAAEPVPGENVADDVVEDQPLSEQEVELINGANKLVAQMAQAAQKEKKYKYASYGLAGASGLGGLAALISSLQTARRQDGASKAAKGAGIAAAMTALLGLGGAAFAAVQKKRLEERQRARARALLRQRELIAEKARAKEEAQSLWKEVDLLGALAEKLGMHVPTDGQ